MLYFLTHARRRCVCEGGRGGGRQWGKMAGKEEVEEGRAGQRRMCVGGGGKVASQKVAYTVAYKKVGGVGKGCMNVSNMCGLSMLHARRGGGGQEADADHGCA